MAALRSKVKMSLGPFFNATVSVHGATDSDEEVALNNVCLGDPADPKKAHNPSGVRQSLTCPVCSNADKATFQKGRKVGSEYVIVPPEAIEAAAVPLSLKEQMELAVHKADEVNEFVNGAKVYYLTPDKGNESIYALFVALVKSRPDLSFCTTWAARTKAAMYRLTTFGDVLAMQMVAWPDDVRAAPEVSTDYDSKNLALATQIADMAISPFDPTAYKDDRRKALADYIASAEGLAGADVPAQPGSPSAVPANSLTAMLEAAIAAATPAPAPAPAKRTPRKKAAAAA